MKTFTIIIAAICFFCSPAYGADDCDSEYAKLIEELKNSNMFESEKKKYLPELERALQLCREGKDEEADKLVKELKDRGLSEELFSGSDGN
ncbi:hypothetical protein D1AOALGA4SA_10703 [Olavius algarvensis Delta 1 endosymbiont]|nr:hypothetical protein D1AOALGA4SA_10703 [Olavius algarvensis Delta 1 endosymbiont]